MGIRNRYLFLKCVFPKSLIVFEKNNKLISYGMDKELLNYIKIDHSNVNYVVIKNMSLIKNIKYENNLYYFYYIKINLLKLVDLILKKIN